MVLITRLVKAGIQVGVTENVASFDVLSATAQMIPSEHYLREIELEVQKSGGWEKITVWFVSAHVESYTSVRGLITLVNALAPLHSKEVQLFEDNLSKATLAIIPLEPDYFSEPNISLAKKVS
ncbi:hypothetical protein COV06_01550 [Candidatus Uhrbacteria bacterium CG10_big_fil_rev_8_21_14_0_10_50_16]|uniref:Uncharacterized protein n=1 Tax=Candidatus Uhrbacteria bacterium CG10_big_fil_rev_8_21_14_0_10_50_16 TaxID=1975039 RepID=A0A2H0RQ07_9BACT|nr:MAG: hypothetical protein COV06_01550 [Candidatus Uhrbacteria bacterium CG10_big_fil_rev_8_21_14_0_10_50_16]